MSSATVLVVEDEYLVSLGITSLLEDLGYGNVIVAARVADACVLAEREPLLFAVLDINVAGEMSWPVAQVLKSRGIPFFFLSGYLHSSVQLPPDIANTRICTKPPEEVQVSEAIQSLFASTETTRPAN